MYSGISFERFPAVHTTPRQLARSYVFCITSHKSPVTSHELSPFPASLTRHLFLSPLLPTLTECPSVSPLLPTLTKYQGVGGPPLLTSPRPKMGIAPETWTAAKSAGKTLGSVLHRRPERCPCSEGSLFNPRVLPRCYRASAACTGTALLDPMSASLSRSATVEPRYRVGILW
jgi:hypothetical protein